MRRLPVSAVVALSLLIAAMACVAARAVEPAAATQPSAAVEQGAIRRSHDVHVAAAGSTRPADESSSPKNSGYWSQVLLALGVVIVLILVLRSVSKRMFSLSGGPGSSKAMSVLARVTISPKQQLMILKVGRRLVVVANCGTQMNPLCQITDAEEVAELVSQTAAERGGSVSKTFSTFFGRSQKTFERDMPAESVASAVSGGEAPAVDPAVGTTRAELNGLMEKVRGISEKFRS